MIGIRLSGRLGNQLFQYAFAISISKKLGVKFFLDDSNQNYLIDKYFKINTPLLNRIKSKNFKLFNYLHNKLQKYFFREINFLSESPPLEELTKAKNWSILTGYFQSILYFEEQINEVRKHLVVNDEYCIKTQDYFEKGFSSIVIHIRRGDYVTTRFKENNCQKIAIEKSYFVRAIEEIKRNLKDDYKIYIVSDEINEVKKEFREYDNEFIYLSNSEIIDFQILQKADFLILSNSSFSWWAGFLNINAKKIVAPKYWCGFANEKIFPNSIDYKLNWIWI